MNVGDIMSEEVFVIHENEQIGHARNLMLKHGFSRIVVINEDEIPIGIVTERDITKKLKGNGPAWKRRPIDKIAIRRVMSNDLKTTTPDANLKDIVELMLRHDISSIPVVDMEGIAGIITKTDLVKYYSGKTRNTWKVKDLMSKDVITVNENHTIAHVISLMGENGIDGIVVIADNEPIGIITSENLSFAYVEDPETGVSVEKIYFVRKAATENKKNTRIVSMLTAGDIMANHLIKISKDDEATKAAKIMIENDVSHVPVVEDDELVGIITKTDIIRGIQ